jgi:hypothetical protein
MKCYKCGREVKEGMMFCPFCRASMSTGNIAGEYCDYINNRDNKIGAVSESIRLRFDGTNVYEADGGLLFYCGNGKNGYMLAYPEDRDIILGFEKVWSDFFDFEYDISGVDDYRVEPMVLRKKESTGYALISKGKVHARKQVLSAVPVENAGEQMQYGESVYDVRTFVQSNGDYYSKHFNRFADEGAKVCFNPVILLVAPLWLVYRRLYLQFFIYLLILLFTPFAWVAHIFYSLFGVRLYYGMYSKIVRKRDDKKFITKSGGNIPGVALVIFASILFVVFVF